MRLTPIQIRQHRFSSRFRGLDPHEVEAFLETVVTDFEDVVRENAQLRRDLERLGRELETYRGREQTIQETLVTAQGVVDGLKRTAIKESELIVSEAEVRAEKALQEAEARRGDLAREIDDLRHLRARVEEDLRRTLQGYLSLLETYAATAPADPGAHSGADGRPGGGDGHARAQGPVATVRNLEHPSKGG